MADNTIDTLAIKISSDSRTASASIERLASALLGLQNAVNRGENGINKLSNAIRNLTNSVSGTQGLVTVSASLQRFASSVKILGSIDTSKIDNTASSIQKLALSMQRLSNINTGNLGSNITPITESLKDFIKQLKEVGTINPNLEPIYNISRAISSLSKINTSGLSDKMVELANALKKLQESTIDVDFSKLNASGILELSKALSSLGSKNALAAPENIEKLATSLNRMMTTLSHTPAVSQNLIQMTQALAQLAANLRGVSSSGSGAAGGLLNVGSAASRTKKHVFSLAAAFGKFYATYWLVLRGFRLFKKAIDISSDLTEVQNVVDVTFGDMKQKVEDLASTSIQDFGMSELTVKQISSRFQAMGVAMGISTDQVRKASNFLKQNNNIYGETVDSMADVSIELTKLAADMASFYNVEQSMVAEKLSSIFTGQTRPLRDFGLDLTQATLQEWAMKQGLDADIKSMSQAEKTMLRFQYVMQNSAASMGDYARTADTWHNSVVRLGQSFEQLGSVIGGALINAFKPLVAWLNRAMQSVIAFAQTVVNALGKIFGWTYEIKNGGVSTDFEDAGIGAEEMADGTGAAKDNLEDMQKYIAAWHEVNNMTTKDDDAGGGKGGGGAGGGIGSAAGGQLVQTEGLLDKYKSDIDSLYELGEYIGKVLTDAMNGINWEKVYEGARNFGTGLADFLNGLISPELFGAVGRTIAGSLNTAVYAALAFGERFDWTDFGKSIATGINEFFKMFDFASLAKTINVWANGILDAIIKAIDTIDWGMIGTRIGTFLAEIDFLQIAGKVMKTLWKALNAAFETYEGIFETAPLETAFFTLVGVTKLLKVGKIQKFIVALKNGIATTINFGKALFGSQTALSALQVAFPKLSKVVEILSTSFMIFFHRVINSMGVFTGLNASLSYIRDNMTNMQKGITTAVAAFAEFMIVKDSVKDIVTGTGNLAVNLLELGAAAGIAGLAMYTALGPAGIAIAAITALVAALVGVKSALDDIEAESTMNSVGNALRNPGGTPLDQITHEYQDMVNGISDSFDKINQKAEELDATKQHAKETSESIDLIKFAIDNGSSVAEEKIPQLKELFNNLLNDSKSIFEQEYDVIMLGISGSLQQSLIDAGYSIEQIVGMMDSLKSSHQQAIDEITQKNAELEQSYVNGEISNEEYTAAMMENYTNLAELTGKTDEYANAISGVSDAVSGVDFSQFINEDNTLNTAALADQFSRLSETANEAKDSIHLSSDSLTTALSDYETEALRVGDSEAASAISDMLSSEAQNVDLAVSEVDKSLLLYADTVQTGLLEKIPDVVDQAVSDYEKMGWLYKLTHTEADYVQEALDEYQTSVIDPATQSLESMYSEVGINGAGWASDASNQIIDSLFTTDETILDMGVTQQTTSLNGAYREVVEGAVAGLDERAKELGTITGSYLTEGIAEGAKAGRSMELIKNSASEAIDAYDRSVREAGQINSPSERMKPIGMYLLQGIIEGFTSSIGQWTTSIATWATDTYNLFSANITKTITDATAWFSELPGKIYTAIFPTNERVTTWGGEVFRTFQTNVNNSIAGVVSWFSELPGKIYGTIINFVTQTLPQWKWNIDDFFGREIPNIIRNVVNLFGDLADALVPTGENLIRGLWNGIENLTGWLGSNIGGFCRNVIDTFKSGFDEHSPSKEAFEIGDFFTRGLQNGMADRFGDVYGDIKGFTESISSIKMTPPELDLSIPKMPDYKPRTYDMGTVQSKMQMEFDEKMAQMAYENQRTHEMLQQIIDSIDRKQLIVGDRDIFDANRRETLKFGRRTNKDPYPVYGRYK